MTLLINLIILLPHAAISQTRSFELDHGIGFRKGSNIEDWMDVEANRRYSAEQAAKRNRLFANDGSGSVIGNSIVITTQRGSHVVLNATQVNQGNQILEVNLFDNGGQLSNVEIDDSDTYVEDDFDYDYDSSIDNEPSSTYDDYNSSSSSSSNSGRNTSSGDYNDGYTNVDQNNSYGNNDYNDYNNYSNNGNYSNASGNY